MIGWPQNAYVGQKVVCIDANTINIGFDKLIKNEVYTISEIEISEKGHFIDLKEKMKYPSSLGCRFFISRFRPVIEKKTDISIFTSMLNRNLEKV